MDFYGFFCWTDQFAFRDKRGPHPVLPNYQLTTVVTSCVYDQLKQEETEGLTHSPRVKPALHPSFV